MRFRLLSIAALAAGLIASSSASQARVNITVDLSTQRMHVTSSSGSYTWKVSTGRGKYTTPRGSYRPYLLKRMHRSRKYDNAPMPYSIFYRGGYAIHATNSIRALGAPASHGCVRLAPANAAKLFSMVKSEGANIRITGSRDVFYANNKRSSKQYAAKKTYRKKYAAAKHSTSKKYYAKRYKSKKYYAKTNGKRVYVAAKRYKQQRGYASVPHRGAPLAYAPQHREPTGIFSFFRNPARR